MYTAGKIDAVYRASVAAVFVCMAHVVSAPAREACEPGQELICAILRVYEIPGGRRMIPANAPNAPQGFSENRVQPVQIDAATREVSDEHKVATYVGNVRLVQGDTVTRCERLLVFYDDDAMPSGVMATKIGLGGLQKIRRLEATDGVLVTRNDQTATGQTAVFDMKANTVTLLEGVVVTQAQQVIRGHKLVIDLTAGMTR